MSAVGKTDKGLRIYIERGEGINMVQKTTVQDARWLCIALLAVNVIKFGFFGFQYFPVLDDYIQYHNYSLYDNLLRDVFQRAGTLCTRPLAGLLDAFLWSRFWGHMGLALLAITVLHVMAVWLLYCVFARTGVPCGRIFLAVCTLYPLLTEGTYWISASSRLVVGLFFAALAAFLLCRYLDGSRAWNLAGFAVCNLISYGFYEQVIAVSCLLALFVLWAGRRKWHLAAIPLGNLILVGLYYLSCRSAGVNTARSALSLDFLAHLGSIWEQVSAALGQFHWALLKNSFIRGLELLSGRWWYLAAIGLSAVLFAASGGTDSSSRSRRKAALALLLIAVPFAPFLILEDCHISFRNVWLPFIGFAMLADMVFSAHTARVAAGVLAACCLVCNVSELADYRAVYLADRAICTQIVPFVGDGSRPVYLVGAKPSYVSLSSYFHEHIHNVTQSDWALTGAVRSYAGNVHIQKVVPVPEGYTDFEPGAIVLDIDQNGVVAPR